MANINDLLNKIVLKCKIIFRKIRNNMFCTHFHKSHDFAFHSVLTPILTNK